MNIITSSAKKSTAALVTAALLAFSCGTFVSAAGGPITISPSAHGTQVLASNGSATVLGTFAPDLNLLSSTNATLNANATSSTKAYYGVDVTSSTSSPDVHWKVVVHHATDALASGNVVIKEVGTYNASSGQVRSSPATYNTTVTSGDLVLNGDTTGWNLSSGAAFTNIDEITFSSSAPAGTYTITRSLVNEATGASFSDPFSFTVNLVAAATSTPDTTAPSAPVVVFPVSPASTSTNPLTINGTAEADSSISITGGASNATATTTGSGNWSASVNLTASSTNTLLITATDASGNTSSSTTLVINHSATGGSGGGTGTSTGSSTAPVITLVGDNPAQIFGCNGYVEPGFSAVDSAGVAIAASSTSSTNNINVNQEGTYTVTYTATDSAGHTATTTRNVTVVACGSGSGSSGTGDAGSSRTPNDTNVSNGNNGMVVAGMITGFPFVGIPSTGGEVLGATSFQFTVTLHVGMSGPDVVELQRRLTETGYFHGPITGYFGPKTRASLMRLQRANGLAATGELDSATIILLNS